MTADTPSLLTAARPGLADLRARVRSTLSPEAQAEVDGHVTQAQRLLEEVFAGLVVWMLHGSADLWARASDVASIMDVLPNSMPERITSARKRGEILAEDIRRGVMDSDVSSAITGPTSDCLTTSPRGCTMLSLRAIRRLVVTCEGDRGRHFRSGLERALEFADQAERAILELVLADRERSAPAPESPSIDAWARGVVSQLAANGAKVIPKDLVTAAMGAASRALAGTVSDAVEPDFGDDFRSSLSRASDLLGCASKTLRRRLERVGMWNEPQWVRHGTAQVRTGRGLREEPRHYLHRGALHELAKRERGELFNGRGDA